MVLWAYFTMPEQTKALFGKLRGCMHPLRNCEVIKVVHTGSSVLLKALHRHVTKEMESYDSLPSQEQDKPPWLASLALLYSYMATETEAWPDKSDVGNCQAPSLPKGSKFNCTLEMDATLQSYCAWRSPYTVYGQEPARQVRCGRTLLEYVRTVARLSEAAGIFKRNRDPQQQYHLYAWLIFS